MVDSFVCSGSIHCHFLLYFLTSRKCAIFTSLFTFTVVQSISEVLIKRVKVLVKQMLSK